MRKLVILVALLGVATPGLSQTVAATETPVGIIDVGMTSHYKIKDVRISTIGTVLRSVDETEDTHGSHTIDAVSKGFKSANSGKLNIVYSTPFSKRDGALKMDWQRAFQALDQMHEMGVTYVCTTFVTHDQRNSALWLAHAKELNMTVVASLGNGEIENPFPAMLPASIAVLSRQRRFSTTLMARANYVVDGDLRGKGIYAEVTGSSFAAAYQCGVLAGKLS